MSLTVSSVDEVIGVLRDRAREIGATRRDIDHTAGCADGYSAKVLSLRPHRRIVTESFFRIAWGLGFRVILEEDPSALQSVRPHCTRRRAFGANQYELTALPTKEPTE